MRHQVNVLLRLLFSCFVITLRQVYANGSVGCLRSETGSEYLGEQNVTSSGRHCVRWDEVQGAFRDYIRITFLALPDRNASNAKNFCRNPNNDSRGVWCFVNLLGNVQFCNVPRCNTPSTPLPPSTAPTTTTVAPPSTTTQAVSSSTTAASQVTTTFLVTMATNPAFRHGMGWESQQNAAVGTEVDDTMSDYAKPVVISNSFEELSAPRSTGVIAQSTPSAIHLTVKQPAAAAAAPAFSGSNNLIIDVPPQQPTTTVVTAQPSNYQRRPFDEWEEDPMAISAESVSADDTSAAYESSQQMAGGISEKIFNEDATGGVKMVRTGANILLGVKKELENELNAKVVIQRSSHLSSKSSKLQDSSLLLLTVLILTTLL